MIKHLTFCCRTIYSCMDFEVGGTTDMRKREKIGDYVIITCHSKLKFVSASSSTEYVIYLDVHTSLCN